MISSIRINNFRGIKTAYLENLSNVNILIGPNSVGKTSILESLFFCSGVFYDRDILNNEILTKILNRKIIRNVIRNEQKLINLRYNYWMDKDIEFLFKSNDTDLDIKISLDNNYEIHSNTFPENLFMLKSDQNIEIKVNNKTRINTNIHNINNQEIVNLFGPDKFKKFFDIINLFKNVIIMDSDLISRYPEIEEKFFFQIIKTRKDKDIISILNDAYDIQIENLHYAPSTSSRPSLLVTFSNETIRVDDLGDGFRLALIMMILIYGSDIKLILIEELENHQHPKALRSLCKTLFKFSVKSNTQIFIATHSSDVIKYFLDASSEVDRNSLKIFNLIRNNGVIKATTIQESDAQALDEMGIDLRFLSDYGK